MLVRSLLPRAAALSLGLALAAVAPLAHADTFSQTGTFAGDDSVYTLNFTNSGFQTYTFSTSSYAAGGFIPVLTLFNSTGQILDNNGTGTADATLMDTLSAGNYILTLSEFPNFVANGSSVDPNNIAAGYEFYGDPTITGELAGEGSISFVDDITGQQRTNVYALSGSSVAATPEPASWLLVLPPAVALAYMSRRRKLAF